MAKKGLGRGLDVLLGDAPKKEVVEQPTRLPSDKMPIEFIIPDPKQPRKSFADEAIEELSNSIREKGLLQPILVRPADGKKNYYMIVAGERRWRAAQRAQVHEVPVIIREFSDAETAEIALIENLQRVDLNPIEEAEAYDHLAKAHERSHNQIASAVGKSRSHVANMLRLLQLPGKVRERVRDGLLSMGHARAILGAEKPEDVADLVIEKEMSVRATEALVREESASENPSANDNKNKKSSSGSHKKAGKKDADTRALERDIAEALGLEVSLEHSGKNGGSLIINYQNLDQLDDVCRRLINVGI